MRAFFGKNQRLNSKSEISTLFSKGKRINGPGISLIYFSDQFAKDKERKVLISVPKKYHKRAVTRNLIKRRIREVYRNSINLYPVLQSQKKLNLALIVRDSTIRDFNELQSLINLLLQRLEKKIQDAESK